MYLPEFILHEVNNINTSLGDNAIFGGDTIQLTSKLLQDRYKQVITRMEELFGYLPTVDEAKTRLSRSIVSAQKAEQPIKNQLEGLCESMVNRILAIPQETMLINCELVKKINPYHELRVLPEQDNDDDNTFSDVMGGDFANEVILKRRAIDSLVQGISYLFMTATYDADEIREWSDELPDLYEEIIALNDYLLFSEKEDISDKNPMLGAYVATHIGKSDEKSVIDAQGLVYPLLLEETYRGIFEVFATHGLPNDIKEAKYVIRRADFLMAEPWDLRIGVPLWQEIDKCLDNDVDSTIYPYLFSSIVSMDDVDFNELFQMIFTDKKGAKQQFEELVEEIKHDKEYQLFKSDIARFNLEKSVISDGDEIEPEEIISEEN